MKWEQDGVLDWKGRMKGWTCEVLAKLQPGGQSRGGSVRPQLCLGFAPVLVIFFPANLDMAYMVWNSQLCPSLGIWVGKILVSSLETKVVVALGQGEKKELQSV